MDTDTPPPPSFALSLTGQGTVELSEITFTTLANTETIQAGTLGLFYWDELDSPTTFSLASDITATDTTITLNAAGPAVVGQFVQIESELLEVMAIASGGTQYQVVRGSFGSTAVSHAAATSGVSLAAFGRDDAVRKGLLR